ncbi:TetR/AcrR family transcriptional regulator [Amaricoccus tamworthensis]|uniref:TetR/AcrR family transcriptional regulator n=1 Tax=Amaricoccus tamworthensis TaxID=57002 RepID=UPI003C7B8F7A
MPCSKRSSARGRPRAFDIDKGIEVAGRMFRERGYDGVGVAELVKAIGIKPPSFYAAYGSKKALLAQVLERYGSHDGSFVHRLCCRNSPLAETAEKLFESAARAYTSDPSARGCLVMEGTRNCGDPEACALTDKAHSELHDELVTWISHQAPQAASELADYVLVVLAGMSAQARAGTGRDVLLTSARIASTGFRAELDRLGVAAVEVNGSEAPDQKDHRN